MNGYKKANITPYMHIMVYHIPNFFELYKAVKVFTGQGEERNNDVARNIVLHKSNKFDSTADILRLESRKGELKNQERSKRTYENRMIITGNMNCIWQGKIKAGNLIDYYCTVLSKLSCCTISNYLLLV
jgi:hypothetical protein